MKRFKGEEGKRMKREREGEREWGVFKGEEGKRMKRERER